MRTRRAAGFTLVEMIVVMAVMGILAVGIVFFITNSAEGYRATEARQELAGRGRFALERMVRMVRRALPGSVRTNGSCLELVPTRSGAYYLDLPVGLAATSFQTIPPSANGLDGSRIAVASGADAYTLSNPGRVSPTVNVGPVDVNQEATVTFAAAHEFVSESAANRFFWVASPVSFCIDAGNLWRYENYGFNAVQPSVGTLPAALPDRALLAENVVGSFSVAPPTLQRNAVVDMALSMNADGGAVDLAVSATVQVRNVP